MAKGHCNKLREQLQKLRALLIDPQDFIDSKQLKTQIIQEFCSFSLESQTEILKDITSDTLPVTDGCLLKNVLAIAIIDCVPPLSQIQYLDLILDKNNINQELIVGLHTPLEKAFLAGHLSIVEWLIQEKQAEPNIELTKLHPDNIVPIFITLKKVINRRIKDNKNQEYAPLLVVENVGKQLLATTTNYDPTSVPGQAICEAFELKYNEQSWKHCYHELILAILLQGLDFEKDKPYIYSLLSSYNSTLSEYLTYYCSADINAQDKYGETPLHRAAWRGDVEAIKTLHTLGADIEAKNQSRETPLHLAVWNGNVEAIKTLHTLGADITAQNKYGETPLHRAAWLGNVEAIKTPHTLGADIEAKNQSRETPLHLAALRGKVEVIKTLHTLRENINAKNKYGWLPLLGYLLYKKGVLDKVCYKVLGLDEETLNNKIAIDITSVPNVAKKFYQR